MRAFELLSEAGLSNTGLRQSYLDSLISMITAGTPISVTPDVHDTYGKTVIIDPIEAGRLQQISDATGGKINAKGYLALESPIGKLKLKGKNSYIKFTSIEKSAELKGKEADYNIGDIGEIALGVAVGLGFLKGETEYSVVDFVKLAQEMNLEQVISTKGKPLKSLKLTLSGNIKHKSGKIDNLKIIILAPGRSVKTFKQFMDNPGDTPSDMRGTILSALQYAKNEQKIKSGLVQTSKDPNTNTIEVICDGVSDQRGTKADLEFSIDGNRINLISAKTGPSQLGQASGHEWKKQKTFFSVVFQEDVSQYEKSWGQTNQTHLDTLIKIYQNIIIPKIQRLTGGDSVQKEIELVRSISNGLIRYANNFDEETGKVETVDIVKLIVDPGSPGFTLMKIDEKLSAALEKADLVGSPTKNNQGIMVSGNVNGKSLLLFKARAYYSPAGDVVRNIIEGGPLLDQLATVSLTPNTLANQ
jgi:hypothetical protein